MPRYLILNKPFGVLCQFTPELPGQRTLAEFSVPADVYPAGRLDADSEGLVLLTDDGPFIKRLLEPGKGHERSYWVQVEGVVTEAARKALEAGVRIGDYVTLPCSATIMDPPAIPEREPPVRFRKSVPTSWLLLKLREGKNRQVRRMTAAVGNPTLRLLRVAIGPIELGSLPAGQWRELMPQETADLTRPTLTKRTSRT
jgi:23S rRNA pseudouridine2457 synthase